MLKKGVSHGDEDIRQARFVQNDDTLEAHWIPLWLGKEDLEKIKPINHHDEQEMQGFLAQSKITPKESFPTPYDLDLRKWQNGFYHQKRWAYSKEVEKHKGHKLDEFQIVKIYRWGSGTGYPPPRCLLIVKGTKQVWEAPPHYYVFLDNDILDASTYRIFPARIPVWRRLYGYKFRREVYSENDLLKRLGVELP